MAVKQYIEAIHDALQEEMARDERVFVLGEDVGVRGGVFRVTAGLIEQFGEYRVLDFPLTESAIVGVAIGAAAAGMIPVAEIQFADFILPAVNQIISEAAKFRYRSNNDWNCPIVIRAPYGGGIHGALYHSQSMEALFTHVPGLKIVTPSTPEDAKGLLVSAIRDPDPVLFLNTRNSTARFEEKSQMDHTALRSAMPRCVAKATTSPSSPYGLGVHLALDAASHLEKEGISDAHSRFAYATTAWMNKPSWRQRGKRGKS